MVARVTHYRIRPGKLEEFTATVQSLTTAMDKLKGFRVLLVLRGDQSSGQEAMAMSIWDSVENMKDSDSDSFYYHVVSKFDWLLRELLADARTGSHGQQIRKLLTTPPADSSAEILLDRSCLRHIYPHRGTLLPAPAAEPSVGMNSGDSLECQALPSCCVKSPTSSPFSRRSSSAPSFL
jgi:hypothetical protein